MLFDHKIVGLVKESNSQLNVGKDTGRIDFRKGGEGGVQIEPFPSPGRCGEVVSIISH